MKKCIKKNGSRICAMISEKEDTSLRTDSASFNKEDIKWWSNEEISYELGLNWINGNWYYFLFRKMHGRGGR